MPFSFDAFGSFVAKRMPMAGREAVSVMMRIFVAIVALDTSCVLSPVTVNSDASGARGSRLLMLKWL